MTHANLDAAKDHLGRLIAHDTTSAKPNRPIIDHMAAYFGDLGADVTILPEGEDKANLIARFGPERQPGIVLSGHTDVVPARASDWTTPPFDMDEREGRLYGRGTCDMKGFGACVMAVAPALAKADLSLPVYLCFSHDEEVGCKGAPAIARHLAALDVPPMLALIGEPTEMRLVTGQKGKIAMRAHVRGTAGHSSFAPSHVNALEYAARIIEVIQDRGRAFAADGPFDADFTVPHATMLATTIEGGVATNVTPDHCSFTFELRSIDETRARADMDAVLEESRQRFEPEMQRIAPEAGIEWEEVFAYPAMGDASGTPGFDALRAVLPEWGGKVSFGSEGGVFEVTGGIPSVIVGPGSIAQAHKADEFVEVAQLDECLHFLDRVIEAAQA